jgi:predicted transposase YdaD
MFFSPSIFSSLLKWLNSFDILIPKWLLINASISDKTGETIMTLAEQWLRRGELKGKLEGKLETAQEMVDQGLDINLIAKVTHLPIEKIKALKKH